MYNEIHVHLINRITPFNILIGLYTHLVSVWSGILSAIEDGKEGNGDFFSWVDFSIVE